MGAYRSKPEKEKIYESGGNESIRFASCSMQGWRIHQEDAHNCIIDFMPKMSFFAVYDGHGGPEVAQYLSLHFPDYLKNSQILNNFDSENLPALKEIQNLLGQAFLQFDETLANPNVMEKLTILKEDSSRQKDSPKTEKEEQDELMAEAIALSEESRTSLDKIIKRYTKYQEYLIKNQPPENVEGEVEEEEVIEWSTERASRRATKRSVMLFNSPQIPKRIKLSGQSETEKETGGSSKSASSETEKPPEEKETCIDDIPVPMDKEETSPTNGKIDEKISKNNNEEGNGKIEAVQLIAGKEEELVLPALEEYVVSSTSTTSHTIDSGQKIKTPKKTTITTLIREEKNQNIVEQVEEGPSSSSSSLDINKDNKPGIAQLLEGLDEGNNNNEEEDSDYKVEDDEGDVADSTSNEVEDEEEEDLNSLMMRTGSTRAGFDSGSTACVAFLLEKHIIVANVGDTRSVLCRSKQALDLSSDHKPEDELEKERIVTAGGNVSSDGRVNGGLNLSRAFGDHFYKQESKLSLSSQQIIALPDITVTQRDFENDEFLVVACDGIWNSLTSQQVCDFILERINRIGLKEIVAEHCCANDTGGDGTGCDNETM
uniref:protein-serine/threonine phosphatase n=1 Tax=Meloidogyne javanica TaxID=6303 RepID=A0A915M8T0_MELJA